MRESHGFGFKVGAPDFWKLLSRGLGGFPGERLMRLVGSFRDRAGFPVARLSGLDGTF